MYLYRRDSGIYFVRLYVPRRLQRVVGKGESHRSTGCRDSKLAKIVAAELAAEWHRALRALEQMDITTIVAGSVQLLGEGYMPLTEAAQILGTTAPSLVDRLIARHAPFFVVANNWLGWHVDDFHQQLDHLHDSVGNVEVVIDERKLGGLGARSYTSARFAIRFSDEVAAISRKSEPVGVCQYVSWPSLDMGFVCDLPGQPLTIDMLEVRRRDVESLRASLSVQLAPEVRAVALSALTAANESASIAPLGPTLETLAKEYLGRHTGIWKPDQLRRRKDQFDLLLGLLGDIPLASINRATMRELSAQIARIPDERHNVRRKYECPKASFRELIDLADRHGLPRLTAPAQARLLDGLSEIFAWAVRETLMELNPAKGLGGEVLRRTGGPVARAHEQRDSFSDDELQLIFSAVWFQHGVGHRTRKGLFHAYRPHYYWLPLLALFAGGRLNELAQLYVDDIRVDEAGIFYIDFNLVGEGKLDLDTTESRGTSDKSLKTINSQRTIPIHSYLINLGFLNYVEALRSAGHTRVFPELKFDETKGYGKAAGSWFNERYLGNTLGIPRDGRRSFHSFRHNYATALGAAHLATSLKSDLMGHSRSKALVESRYDKGASMAQFKEAIDALVYPLPMISKFDIKSGLEAIKHALNLKTSHRKPDVLTKPDKSTG